MALRPERRVEILFLKEVRIIKLCDLLTFAIKVLPDAIKLVTRVVTKIKSRRRPQ